MTATEPTATAAAPVPPERRPPAPTQAELIEQLRADLIGERAVALRLCGFIGEVLGAEPPDDLAVPGWEGRGHWDYWHDQAERTLRADDLTRRYHGADDPLPVMGAEPPPARPDAQEAPCSPTSSAAA